jgi:hypothetical protein
VALAGTGLKEAIEVLDKVKAKHVELFSHIVREIQE